MDDKIFQALAKSRGDLLAQREGNLGTCPNIRATNALRLNDAGMGLDVGLVHRLGRKRILYDDVRFAESSLNVALCPVHVNKDVARVVDRMKQTAIARHVRMKQRRRRIDSRERIEQRFEFLILDID